MRCSRDQPLRLKRCDCSISIGANQSRGLVHRDQANSVGESIDDEVKISRQDLTLGSVVGGMVRLAGSKVGSCAGTDVCQASGLNLPHKGQLTIGATHCYSKPWQQNLRGKNESDPQEILEGRSTPVLRAVRLSLVRLDASRASLRFTGTFIVPVCYI